MPRFGPAGILDHIGVDDGLSAAPSPARPGVPIDLGRLIGRRHGVVSELTDVPVDPDEVPVRVINAARGPLPWEDPHEDRARIGSGCADRAAPALFAAIGELVERYCSSFVPSIIVAAGSPSWRDRQPAGSLPIDPTHPGQARAGESPAAMRRASHAGRRLVAGSRRQLLAIGSIRPIDLAGLRWFDDEQVRIAGFPFATADDDTPLLWVAGEAAASGEPRWVPAELVYFPAHQLQRDMGGGPIPADPEPASGGASSGSDRRLHCDGRPDIDTVHANASRSGHGRQTAGSDAGGEATAPTPATATFRPHWPAMTHGLACGPSREDAAASAVRELIERDALTVAWLNQLAAPRIPPDPRDPLARWWLARADHGYSLTLLDLTTDLGVPVVAAWTTGPGRYGPIAAIGLGCHLDRRRAVRRALRENAHGRLAVLERQRTGVMRGFRDDFADVISFDDHMLVWSSAPHLPERHLGFVTAGPALPASWWDDRPWPPDPVGATDAAVRGSELAELAAQLSARGIEVALVEVTTPDVAQVGLHVVRAVAPGLAVLHGTHLMPFLGCDRLHQPARVFAWFAGGVAGGGAGGAIHPPSRKITIGGFPPHPLG